MNYVWLIMIIFSFFCAIAMGRMSELSMAVINSGSNAIELVLKLTGVICLWNGLSAIAQKSGLTDKLCKLLSPVLKIVFPTLKDKKAKEAIALNITANLLGLGNAATPLGLEAMQRLQQTNPDKTTATDNMVRFVVINSAALHLVPTTIAMLRSEYGSTAPMEILLPALITSLVALIVGISATFILKRFFR